MSNDLYKKSKTFSRNKFSDNTLIYLKTKKECKVGNIVCIKEKYAQYSIQNKETKLY